MSLADDTTASVGQTPPPPIREPFHVQVFLMLGGRRHRLGHDVERGRMKDAAEHFAAHRVRMRSFFF
jgi:hypothetical protein